MPFDVQSDNSLLYNGLLATGAFGSEVGLEAVLAVGQIIPLVERGSNQGLQIDENSVKTLPLIIIIHSSIPSCRVLRRQSAPRARWLSWL